VQINNSEENAVPISQEKINFSRCLNHNITYTNIILQVVRERETHWLYVIQSKYNFSCGEKIAIHMPIIYDNLVSNDREAC
jgi:hypothetical protein